MSESRRVSRLAMLAAGGLLLGLVGGGGAADAACVVTGGTSAGCTAFPSGSIDVASELFGTTDTTQQTAGYPSANTIIKVSSQFGGFGTDDQLLTLTLTDGAKFKTAVVAGDFTSDLNATNCVMNPVVSSGGGVGQSSVTMLIRYAPLTAGGCNVDSTVSWKEPNLTGIIGGNCPVSPGGPVAVTGTLTLASNPAVLVDKGITNSGATWLNLVCANVGTETALNTTIDVGSGNKQFISQGGTCSATQTVLGTFTDKVVSPAPKIQDLNTAWAYNVSVSVNSGASNQTGITLTNLPLDVTAVALDLASTGSGDCSPTAPAAGACTFVFGSGTAFCPLNTADIATLNAAVAPGGGIIVTIDGTTVINPPIAVNSKLFVDNAPSTYVDVTKFNGTGGTFSTNACTAEFATVFGVVAENAGYKSSFRVANESNIAARLFAGYVNDAGLAMPPIQITQTAGTGFAPASAAYPAWDGGSKVKSGATIEITGTDLANIGAAVGVTFTGISGNRARLRLFLETKAAGGSGTITPQPYSSSPAGCTMEMFMCSPNGTCVTNKASQAGTDNLPIAVPNK